MSIRGRRTTTPPAPTTSVIIPPRTLLLVCGHHNTHNTTALLSLWRRTRLPLFAACQYLDSSLQEVRSARNVRCRTAARAGTAAVAEQARPFVAVTAAGEGMASDYGVLLVRGGAVAAVGVVMRGGVWLVIASAGTRCAQ